MFYTIRHHLKSPTPSDWFIALQTQDELTVSGWIHIAPQRFLLLLLPLFSICLIYHMWFIALLNLGIAFWVLRRFTLDLNEYDGLSIVYDLFGIQYAKKYFPLDVHPQIGFPQNSFNIDHNLHPIPPQIASHLYLVHNQLQFRLVHVVNGPYQRVNQLKDLIQGLLTHLQYKRLHDPQSRRKILDWEEPGEWKLSLIELFPFLLGPRSHKAGQDTFLSWWAPQPPATLGSILLFILLPFITLGSWWIYLGGLSGIGFLIYSQRQFLWVSPKGIVWEEKCLGLSLSYLKWPLHAHIKLFKDLHAPNGRGVTIHLGHQIHNTQFIASPCEAFWVYSQLQNAIHFAQLPPLDPYLLSTLDLQKQKNEKPKV